MLNVAVRKKLLPLNPCSAVEFPVAVKGLFRPHYVTWSEQQKIEWHGPQYLRNFVRIITETGLRIYRQLTFDEEEPSGSAKCGSPDIGFEDSEWYRRGSSPSLAIEAFESQMAIACEGPFLFSSDRNPRGHQASLKTVWRKTLRRARNGEELL